MNRRTIFQIPGWFACLGLAAVLLLAGCSSLKVLESWQSPAKTNAPYQTLLIVGIANDRNVRTLFENIVADELSRTGVTAVASHNYVTKDLDKAHQDDIVAAVKKIGADAVITARPVAIGDTTVTQQGVPTGGVYGTTGNGFYTLPGTDTFFKVTLQTNLYDTKTTQLVWSATISTYDADNKVRVCRELGRLFAERLRRDGLLK